MSVPESWPDSSGHFGPYGGRFVPETLISALDELERDYDRARQDPAFQEELRATLRDFAGRPTPLIEAQRFSERAGCRVFLKREDLLHTGAHKINNTIGQCLLTRRMGKPRVIAETGAGQHGVATAAAAARFDLRCVVYMGEEDARRQHLNVQRMKLLGAEVRTVDAGSKTLKDAINEALRDWVTNVGDTHACWAGPASVSMMVRTHRVIGGSTGAVRRRPRRAPDALRPWAAGTRSACSRPSSASAACARSASSQRGAWRAAAMPRGWPSRASACCTARARWCCGRARDDRAHSVSAGLTTRRSAPSMPGWPSKGWPNIRWRRRGGAVGLRAASSWRASCLAPGRAPAGGAGGKGERWARTRA
jgi:hypothetical protein